MMQEPDTVSVVVPTYNRLGALRENLPALLALEGVDEVVIVVDGSTDGTVEWLAQLSDPRLKTIVQAQQGSPGARNRGIDGASSTWILMTEDDCLLPRDFAVILRAAAHAHGADIVGAPWLVPEPGETADDALRRARANVQPTIDLHTHPGVFPAVDYETPFLNGIFLARRTVFDHVRYGTYGGNAWREETDLFLTATESGFRCLLTGGTASYQLRQWDGGQRRSRARYEGWVIRNNWIFLRRHADLLRRLGQIRAPASAQLAFVAARISSLGDGVRACSLARLDALGDPAIRRGPVRVPSRGVEGWRWGTPALRCREGPRAQDAGAAPRRAARRRGRVPRASAGCWSGRAQ